MATKADSQLLRAPWKCLFCPVKESGLDSLLFHSLSKHPLEYILLRRQFEANNPEGAETKTSSNKDNTAEPKTKSSNGKTNSKSKTKSTESKATTTPKSSSRSSSHSHSPTRHSHSSKEATPKDTKVTASKSPLSTHSTSPKHGSRQSSSRHRSSSQPRRSASSTRREPKAASPQQAERCKHNVLQCNKFPFCWGRLCAFRHPPCPMGPRNEVCLARDDCPFHHPDYEQECGFPHCRGNRRITIPNPGITHCPHYKLSKCRLGTDCEKRAQACPGRHADWADVHQAGQCRISANKCPNEHFPYPYFCPDCLREHVKAYA